MLAVPMMCLPLFITGNWIARWEGVLLGYYIAYTGYLVLAAKRQEGAEAFGDAMLGFVTPLTIAALGAALLRQPDTTPHDAHAEGAQPWRSALGRMPRRCCCRVNLPALR